MKIIGFIIIFSLLLGKEPKPLDQFVVNYLLLTQSKMVDSPVVWQDVRQGYLRNEAIYFSEIILDSIADGLAPYHVVKTHLPNKILLILQLGILVNKKRNFFM